jgi:hypothetical protein
MGVIRRPMATTIYDKTTKGQEEIQTRKFQLASRLRSLLVLVDGKATEEMLLKKVAGLGLTIDSLSELLRQGFIAAKAAADNVQAEVRSSNAAMHEPAVQAAPASTAAPVVLAEGETLYQALYNFYTSTIKANLGLRGYAMQLKVERCSGIDDFKALRPAYLEAIQKSKGPEMANVLMAQLDQLLALS